MSDRVQETLKLDDGFVDRVKELPLLARLVVDGYFHGLHRSHRRGSSPVFVAHRPYMPGDPARLVDWRVWARTNQFFIREYEQETNLNGYLFLDTSKSMSYGDGGQNKIAYGQVLAGALAMLLSDQNDAPAVGLLGRNRESEVFLPPSSRGDHLHSVFQVLAESEADGLSEGLGAYEDLLSECRGRALTALITDGYFPVQQGRELMTELRERGHEVLFFHLLHRDEMDPKYEGDILFIDSETGEEMETDGASMRLRYQENLNQFLKATEDLCFEMESAYCRIITDEGLETALSTFLTHRASMAQGGF